MSDYSYDLIVIGAGPGGYVSAIRASQVGLNVVVIEKDNPGGVCLNWGCIPSKSLISQAQKFSTLKDLKAMGINIDTSTFNYETVYKKSRLATSRLSRGVEFLLKKNNIELIKGTAKILDRHTVTVDNDKHMTAKNILIATGSRPKVIPGLEFDKVGILSSTEALSLTSLPQSIVIIGAGAIGVEFAYILSSFGVQIHLVEMLNSILPLEDKDVSDILAKAFKKSGVKIYTSTKASISEKTANGYKVTLESGEQSELLETEKILVAVGRTPNSDQLGLEKLGIKTERGFIETGDYYETNIPGIYAIGDVINTPLLAHVASKEGEIVVTHLAGMNPEKRIDPTLIPSAVYTEPQIASFGYTEAKAKEAGIPFTVYTFPYRGAGKAVAIEEPDGLVKLVCHEKTHEILGAHIVGKEATELIHEILLARKGKLLPKDIATMIHAHPTLSEAVMEAARGIEKWAIHG
ncbi:MAG: dihydrolipoyl dehydrogenase [Candidatus Marinimicrobia bacterium]|nr:dihydrolipoyl dehydrogenase [Candidatus Neomarinimicrobiota bacterium]